MKMIYADSAIDGLREMRARIKRMAPGEGLVYHTGETWTLPKRPGNAALALEKEGWVRLVQKRVGTAASGHPVRDYIAVKRKLANRSGEIARHLAHVAASRA